MEKYGTYVTFRYKDNSSITVDIAFDDQDSIKELEKNSEWIKLLDEHNVVDHGKKESKKV